MQEQPGIEPRTKRASIMLNLSKALQANKLATSLDEVVRHSSVSQEEMKDAFGSTQELMVAMVAQLSQKLCEPLSRGPSSSENAHFETLREFAELVIDTYLRSHLPVLYRIGVTDAIRNTGVAQKFYEAGPGCVAQCLAQFIANGQDEGFIATHDEPQLLASHFMAVLRAELDLSDIFPSAAPLGDERADGGASEAIALFRRGVSLEATC